ncbi:MAG: hypothetical protein IKA36_01955 [Clostridia bacterium]|nr:hypothetical protein [Clostridia bacterium]
MNINIDKKDFDYKQYDIDQLLNGSESREVNEYFGIYKLNILCVGGSGSGKTTWIINQILNNILDCDVILCFIPHETLYSGFYQSLLKSEHFYKPILVFEIGHNKQFNGLDDVEEIPIKSHDSSSFDSSKPKRSNYIVQGMPTVSQLFKIKNDLKFKQPLLLFDDFVNVLNKQMWEDYYRYIHNGSRLNAKICSCVQSINKIPPQVRSSYTIVVLFTNYLTHSVITTMLRNCVNNPMLDKNNTYYLLDLISKDPNKHNPLIVIGGDVDQKKSIIYNNNYITFT